MKKRRTFSPEFNSKVALEALRERDSIHEIAKKYQVHPPFFQFRLKLYTGPACEALLRIQEVAGDNSE